MRKFSIFLLMMVLLLLLGMQVFGLDNRIDGIWVDISGDEYLFNNGSLVISGKWPYTYSTNGNILSMKSIDMDETFVCIYSIEGDVLSFTWPDGGIYKLTNKSNKQALVGRWVEARRGWKMDLLSDGTGIYDEQYVTWKIIDYRLYIISVSPFGEVFGDNGSFNFSFSGSVLVLESNGRDERYIRR